MEEKLVKRFLGPIGITIFLFCMLSFGLVCAIFLPTVTEPPASSADIIAGYCTFGFMYFIVICLFLLFVQRITVTAKSVKISLFGRFFVREFFWHEIKDVYYAPRSSNVAIDIRFSKLLPPEKGVKFSKAERKHYRKNTLSLSLDISQIQKIQKCVDIDFRVV